MTKPASFRIWAATLAAAWTLAPHPRAGAAVITWSSAANVTSDADVNTLGTLVNAVNEGESNVPTTTVNGVTFVGVPAHTPHASGNFTFTTDSFEASNRFGLLLPASDAVSPAYRAMLGSAAGQYFGPPITLTIGDLTVGRTYLFQWWWAVSTPTTPDTTATAGNSVTLDSAAGGGFGQYAIGTFVADGPTQVITFDRAAGENPEGAAGLNGAQLRDVTDVPEPAVALLAVPAACLGSRGRRPVRRRCREDKPRTS